MYSLENITNDIRNEHEKIKTREIQFTITEACNII
jgi:hypothetical protein